MKRTPIVVIATLAGLGGVLAFHTSPSEVTLTPSAGTTSPQPDQTSQTGQAGQGSTTEGKPAASPSPTPASSSRSKPATGSKSSVTRTVDGPSVNYSYGVLAVSVTLTGDKIVKVGIASLDDDGNFRSEMIDQQSIPILEQEALQAQSSNIQSVSGASYTSAGFKTSLQAALRSVGLS
jgi:uncharacterized protein with FMN-binding domain